MEVILLENIINLGNIGDKVIVKPGYGRNFLLKTGKALNLVKKVKRMESYMVQLNQKKFQIKFLKN